MTKSSRFVIASHVLALLAHGDGEPLTSDWIAGSVNTNPVVIRRILALLAKAGLVATQEGARGGTRLARPAEEINLLSVYRAVETGELFASHPQPPNPACPVGCHIQGALAPALDAAEEAMTKSLAQTTVADVVRQVKTAK
ncbi:Putative HTH-type transcriptional regulator YwnA [Gemmata sp. SH-PL17]|uniref:Rrf2 family transcriptional regulator n=1 Tax=Gemmata sp. SH-PL17 TaxID=1630693 RepID=UPI00078E014D|nr:Rrf2 family transcriptional regulator [Gemmata sp. SH-PL17]AMV24714.1 Putative HTH-type transcriptional regulator YwnA [Gemmata sp. SH-PL17]